MTLEELNAIANEWNTQQRIADDAQRKASEARVKFQRAVRDDVTLKRLYYNQFKKRIDQPL